MPSWAPMPREIEFPEDKLMKIYQRRNPDWHTEVLRQYNGAKEKTRGYRFVTQWQKYIEAGMTQDDAYEKVNAEFYEIENKITEEQEQELLRQLRSGTVPAMVAFQNEEEKYVQEAIDYHRNMWETRKRASQVKAVQMSQVANPAVTSAPDDSPEQAAAPAGKGKNKTAKPAKTTKTAANK